MVMGISEPWQDQRCGPQPLSCSLLSLEPWPHHWPDWEPCGAVYTLFSLGQDPGQSVLWVVGPRAVTRAFLSAEDEVDMLNDGQDSEEKITLPSCYGGIGAHVGRQGESRG